MSDIAILGDLHFGCHNSSPVHHAYMKKFFADFFEYVDANKITKIIQLGDLFDVRKHINTWSSNFFRETFLKPCISRNLDVWVLLGNHDIYYRESLEVSSVEEVLTPYDNWFHIVKEPTDLIIEDHSFLMVPWVCKENAEAVSASIKKSKSIFCIGHFEFDGFELFKGQMAKSSYKHTEYKKFKQVISGHYHAMSSRDNVLYTGTPYELTWQDSNTAKGFFVLNDEKQLTFVENPHKLYVSLSLEKGSPVNAIDVEDKILKVKMTGSWEPKEREAALDLLYSMRPNDVKLIQTEALVEEISVDTSKYQTFVGVDSMISDYVENIQVNESVDKTRLTQMLLEIFNEACHA